MTKSWENATREEILTARVTDLEDALRHLKHCVGLALRQTALREGCETRPEGVLDDEWAD
jgi:hypothetical protein